MLLEGRIQRQTPNRLDGNLSDQISTVQWNKWAAALLWLVTIASYQIVMVVYGISPQELVNNVLDLLRRPYVGPILFIAFYALQPWLFFPSWLLSIAGGYIYGPIWGSLYALLAGNISGMTAYGIGRFFGAGGTRSKRVQKLLDRFSERMRTHSFTAILVMRLLFLPYDLVSYLSGFLQIRVKPFLLATAIGSIPGTLAFVIFGSAIVGDLSGQRARIEPELLGLSVVLIAVSLLLWRFIQRWTPATG